MSDPSIEKLHSCLFKLLLKRIKQKANAIINTETITGVNTGPTHGTGTKKRISQVINEEGHPEMRYRNT